MSSDCNFVKDFLCKLLWCEIIDGQVVRNVYKCLVYGILMNIFFGKIVKVNLKYVGTILNIKAHARERDNILDVLRNLKQPATIFHSQCFHLWGYCKGNRTFPARFVCNNEIGFKRT